LLRGEAQQLSVDVDHERHGVLAALDAAKLSEDPRLALAEHADPVLIGTEMVNTAPGYFCRMAILGSTNALEGIGFRRA
jgi:hypothetical protein